MACSVLTNGMPTAVALHSWPNFAEKPFTKKSIWPAIWFQDERTWRWTWIDCTLVDCTWGRSIMKYYGRSFRNSRLILMLHMICILPCRSLFQGLLASQIQQCEQAHCAPETPETSEVQGCSQAWLRRATVQSLGLMTPLVSSLVVCLGLPANLSPDLTLRCSQPKFYSRQCE